MENLKRAANLLVAILGDMDRIPVEGLDNQRAFLNCADGIKTAAQVILQYAEGEERKETETAAGEEGAEVNGR